MKKNKKLIILLALVLVAMLAVGITIAWFSDTETKTNIATMGDIDVTLDENVEDPSAVDGVTENPNGEVDDPSNPKYTVPDPEAPEGSNQKTPLIPGTETNDGAEYPSSQPGTSYVKGPTVTNEEEPVFLRLVVTRSWTGVDGGGDISKIILHLINDSDWTFAHDAATGVDYFYYNAILDKNVTTTMPFDYFTISSTVGNEYSGATAKIEVKAEAVQAAGLSSNYANAQALPADIWAGVNAD